MSEQGKRKALIVYASITGNTEAIAMRFKQVFEKYGWLCDTFKCTKKTDKRNIPYHLEDGYDLFCVGGPIWSGIPPLYLYDDRQGVVQPILAPRNAPDGPVAGIAAVGIPSTLGWRTTKGIVFVTYSGSEMGSVHALPALSVLSFEGMERWRIKCIGKFACPGKMWAESTFKDVSARHNDLVLGDTIGDEIAMFARYAENPNDSEFANFSNEDRKIFDKAVEDIKRGAWKKSKDPRTGRRVGHHDLEHRPNERDLLKAEIFLSEIIEDIYGVDNENIEMFPFAEYICIS